MTATTKNSGTWRQRTSIAALGAALAVTAVLGPGQVTMSRLGTSEAVGHATVSAADTITRTRFLTEVAALVRKA